MATSFHGNQHTSSDKSGRTQNEYDHKQNSKPTGRAKDRIAKELGVSATSVQRSGELAKGIDAAEEVAPGTKKKIFTGEVKPTLDEMNEIAKATPPSVIFRPGQICHALGDGQE